MGMYTVFHLDIRLRDDLPINIYNLLEAMLGLKKDANLARLPSHPLFTTATWWEYMLCSENAYASCVSQITRHEFFGIRLCVQSSFKNYNDEIGKFLDWLAPYADPDMSDHTFVGYMQYEDDRYPNVIMYTKDGGAKPKFYVVRKLNEGDIEA